MQGATCGSLDTEATQSTVDPRAAGDELGAEMEPPCGDRGSDNRGSVDFPRGLHRGRHHRRAAARCPPVRRRRWYFALGGGLLSRQHTFVILRELANKMMLQTAADALAAEQAPDTLH